ncbi:protein kinase family protein [Vibrio parahaemolyticus]|nr:protein kinase family protein [Vibrio parahaemolyticus]MDF5575553.1 protein kinase family protein [Vibrio parahaemolyticus]MDG2903153.1 protein kinase family protein [Vibrio parahaemolyticus]
MELQFKNVSGKDNVGDFTWIHQSGSQAVIADMVSGCDVHKGIDLLSSWLTVNQTHELFDAGYVIEQLHELFKANDVQSTLGVITQRQRQFDLHLVGNLRVFKVDQNVEQMKEVGNEIHPLSVVGSPATPTVLRKTLTTDHTTKFILTSDGLDSSIMDSLALTSDALNCGQLFQKLLPAVCDDDWSALIFPMSSSQSFTDHNWSYNPFVGPQEERFHERRGLAEIATELFKQKVFDGFRIVSCPPILSENSSRLFDGLLVYPFGVIPLELKDHHGSITIDMGTNKRNSLLVDNDMGRSFLSNPATKLREALKRFGDLPQLKALPPELKNTGLVIFTSHNANVECLYDGQSTPSPFMKAGEVLVSKSEQLSDLLFTFCRSRFGKKPKRRLTDSEINHLVKDLTTLQSETFQDVITVGDYDVELKPVDDESTDYFTVYNASLFKEQVWAKCFNLDHLSAVHRQSELKSIGREALVLKRLSRVDGVQRYQDKELVDDRFFVFVEKAPEQNLASWLEKNPSREQRISLLISLAETIQQIQSIGEPEVIHRAINLSNVRIDANGKPVLINFELCQQEMVATLPLNARRTFEQKYQAPEVNEPGQSLTFAADVFSFGLITFYSLAGELPFEQSAKELVTKGRRPAFWKQLCTQLDIPQAHVEFWQRILHITPKYRPSIRQVLEILETWK